MDTILWVVVVMAVVIGILGVAAYAVFELTPFAAHVDAYRDPTTHARRFEAPHLETRDEFEHRQR